MIAGVVDISQSGFIPGRQISDNILMATELIKGYTRKGISPRSLTSKSKSSHEIREGRS